MTTQPRTATEALYLTIRGEPSAVFPLGRPMESGVFRVAEIITELPGPERATLSDIAHFSTSLANLFGWAEIAQGHRSPAVTVRRFHYGSPYMVDLILSHLEPEYLAVLIFGFKHIFSVDLSVKAHREKLKAQIAESQTKAAEWENRRKVAERDTTLDPILDEIEAEGKKDWGNVEITTAELTEEDPDEDRF